MLKWFVLVSVVLSAAAIQAAEKAPELNDKTFKKWRDFVVPTKEELAWKEIPWRGVYWDAVVEAQRQEKPILLWAMNGHPLACT